MCTSQPGGVRLLSAAFVARTDGETPHVYRRLPESEIRKHIDRTWIRKALVIDLLDHWLKASVMPNGFIQENLDPRVGAVGRAARSQPERAGPRPLHV